MLDTKTKETESLPNDAMLRLPAVLAIVPVSRSTLWSWVKNGSFPHPLKLGPRTTAWRRTDVIAFLAARATATESKAAVRLA